MAPAQSTNRKIIIPSNAGATDTTKSNLPPAGQQYVQGLSTSAKPENAYDTTSGMLTAYGKSQGLPEVNAPITGGTTGTSAPVKKDTAYVEYLKTLFNPEQARIAQENVNALNQRTAQEIERNRKRDEEIRKNEIGQLERGQSYDLSEESRLSNKSLADLALAKGVSADILKQYTDAGKSIYDIEQPDAILPTGAKLSATRPTSAATSPKEGPEIYCFSCSVAPNFAI